MGMNVSGSIRCRNRITSSTVQVEGSRGKSWVSMHEAIPNDEHAASMGGKRQIILDLITMREDMLGRK